LSFVADIFGDTTKYVVHLTTFYYALYTWSMIISRVAIQSIERKRVLEYSCCLAHLLVCLFVVLSRRLLWQNSWLDMDAIWVMSGVSREMAELDGGPHLLRRKGMYRGVFAPLVW